MDKNCKLTDREAKMEAARRRAKMRAYIGNGAGKLISKPAVSVPALLALLVFVAAIIWQVPIVLADRLNTFPRLVPIFVYALRAFILLVSVLLILGGLYLIGTPHKAKKIESNLAIIFKIGDNEMYRCPFLVCCKKVGTAREYVFKSEYIAVGDWNYKKQDILHTLNLYSSYEFAEGTKPYTIVIHAVSRTLTKERETPRDPLF